MSDVSLSFEVDDEDKTKALSKLKAPNMDFKLYENYPDGLKAAEHALGRLHAISLMDVKPIGHLMNINLQTNEVTIRFTRDVPININDYQIAFIYIALGSSVKSAVGMVLKRKVFDEKTVN